MEIQFEDRHILVCGASQGIGLATARSFASSGAQVSLLSRRLEPMEEALASFPGTGHKALALDLSQWDQPWAELEARHQERPFDTVIFNAGGPQAGPISQAEPEAFLGGMETHLIAASKITKMVLPSMKERKFGRMILITSTSVRMPIPHLGVSNTVRAAMWSWAKTLSLEVAPFGVTINNVMPGFTKTPRLEKLMAGAAQKQGVSVEDVESQWRGKVPAGRFAQPEELASTVLFLCSEQAGYITGQSLAVDGGRLGCL